MDQRKEASKAVVEPWGFLDIVASPEVDPPFGAESFRDDAADGLKDWTPPSRDDELGVRAGGKRREWWLRFPWPALND